MVRTKSTTVLIPVALAREIDQLLKQRSGQGFYNRSEFARQAIREKVERLLKETRK